MLKERLAKLIDVKSIVTILLVLVFSFQVVTGKVTSQEFMTIFSVVIAFDFGTQTAKKEIEAKQ